MTGEPLLSSSTISTALSSRFFSRLICLGIIVALVVAPNLIPTPPLTVSAESSLLGLSAHSVSHSTRRTFLLQPAFLTSSPDSIRRERHIRKQNRLGRALSKEEAHNQGDATMESIHARLREADLALPPPSGPKANYQLIQRDGNTLYLSGHLPATADGTLVLGKCAPTELVEAARSENDGQAGGASALLTTEEGYQAAQHCALNLLSTLQAYLSADGRDLTHVDKVVKLLGVVRSHDDFLEQHIVMNGASDIFGLALGKDVGGIHARSAIGTNSLPLGICVEVEATIKIKD